MAKKKQTTGQPKRRKRATLASQPDLLDQQSTGASPTILGVPLPFLYDGGYRARSEREQEWQRFTLAMTALVGGLAIVILLGAILTDQIIRPNRTVATVDGDRISAGEFDQRVRIERVALNTQLNAAFGSAIANGQDPNQVIQIEPFSTWWLELNDQPDILGSRILDEMLDSQLIAAYAEENGIGVSDEEIEEQIQTFFGFDPEANAEPTATLTPTVTPTPFVSPTPSPTPTPTLTPTPEPEVTEEADATEEASDAGGPTPIPTIPPTVEGEDIAIPTLTTEELETAYDDARDTFFADARGQAGIGRSAVTAYFRSVALREKVREDIVSQQLGETVPHVNARHILVETLAEAEAILAALEAGESFADLARSASTDSGSGQRGGELGWGAATSYVGPFADAVQAAEIGEIFGPVESEFGFHIVQVRAREERPLEGQDRQIAEQRIFTDWLEAQRESAELDRRSNWPNFVPSEPAFVYRPPGGATNTGGGHTG